MGTSIMWGSFFCIGTAPGQRQLVTLPPSKQRNAGPPSGRDRVVSLRQRGHFNHISCGSAIEEVESFLVAYPISDSIERAITRQTRANLLGRLLGLPRQRLNFASNFFVADLNFLSLRNPFQDQRSFYFLQRSLTLPRPQAGKVHLLHLLGAQALGRQGAKPRSSRRSI